MALGDPCVCMSAAGADVQKPNILGETPLYMAVSAVSSANPCPCRARWNSMTGLRFRKKSVSRELLPSSVPPTPVYVSAVASRCRQRVRLGIERRPPRALPQAREGLKSVAEAIIHTRWRVAAPPSRRLVPVSLLPRRVLLPKGHRQAQWPHKTQTLTYTTTFSTVQPHCRPIPYILLWADVLCDPNGSMTASASQCV